MINLSETRLDKCWLKVIEFEKSKQKKSKIEKKWENKVLSGKKNVIVIV